MVKYLYVRTESQGIGITGGCSFWCNAFTRRQSSPARSLCRDGNISHKYEHVEVVKNGFLHLRDLWFSDVCKTKEQLEIDLLIGADYLWEFQKGTTIRGEVEETRSNRN